MCASCPRRHALSRRRQGARLWHNRIVSGATVSLGSPIDAADRAGGIEVEAAVLAIVSLEWRAFLVPAQAETQRQPRRDLPVVLKKERRIAPAQVRRGVQIDASRADRPQQERGDG